MSQDVEFLDALEVDGTRATIGAADGIAFLQQMGQIGAILIW